MSSITFRTIIVCKQLANGSRRGWLKFMMTEELYTGKMVEEILAFMKPILTKYIKFSYMWIVEPDVIPTMTGMDYIKGFFFFIACICLMSFFVGYLCGKSKIFFVTKETVIKGLVRMGYYAGCIICIVLYPFLHHGMLPSKREIEKIKRIWLEG